MRGLSAWLAMLLLLGAGALPWPVARATTAVPVTKDTLPASGLRARQAGPSHPEARAADAVLSRIDSLSFGRPACQQAITGEDAADALPAVTSCRGAPRSRQPVTIALGRRIGDRDEILGEIDGVRVDYRPTDGLRLNGIAGYPVLTEADVFNPARQFFGISAMTDRPDNTWDLNGYLVEQQQRGRVTNRSLGGALRYLEPGHSLLFYLDYEPDTRTLGTLMVSGALKLPYRTTFSATLDIQSRAIPGLQQQYLQQSMTAVDGWDWVIPGDRLSQHLDDGAREVGILAMDLSYPLSRRIRMRGDVVMLDASQEDTVTRRYDPEEYHYHLKITGRDLMVPGDRSILDLRHSVTAAGRSYTALFDTRYALQRFWNFISQLRADYHPDSDDGRPRWEATPTVTMEYRPSRQYGFHIEAGGNLTGSSTPGVADEPVSYFVSLGYRLTF
jgi:hypothetical protein